MFEKNVIKYMSECWPDHLGRSDATFPSKERVQILSIGSLTDWISISN